MKVKSKVRMGAAALLLLCAFLSLCSRRSCLSNLVSALEEGAEGQPESLVEPPQGSSKPVLLPVPVPVSSSPQGAGNQVAFPGCQSAPPPERELALTQPPSAVQPGNLQGRQAAAVVPAQFSSSSSL